MANQLHAARAAKNDEFYTRYEDIEREMNAYVEYNKDVFRDKVVLCPCDDPEWSNFTKYFVANFSRLGLKKLISTSYAKSAGNKRITDFEAKSKNYDAKKHKTNGKIFIVDRKEMGRVDFDDITFHYLEGDGDFRSEEVTALRDESDFIITNEPFSLFIEFINWVLDGGKQFSIIANQNVYTDKDVFPLFKENKIWVGTYSGDMAFQVPMDSEARETRYWEDELGQKWRSMGNATWITNIEHGVRHSELQLMTMSDNLKYNKQLKKSLNSMGVATYPLYENYNAIEVPYYKAIPSDYEGVMGVPVTFLDKFNPEQFEIIGMTHSGDNSPETEALRTNPKQRHRGIINGKQKYARILIRHKRGEN